MVCSSRSSCEPGSGRGTQGRVARPASVRWRRRIGPSQTTVMGERLSAVIVAYSIPLPARSISDTSMHGFHLLYLLLRAPGSIQTCLYPQIPQHAMVLKGVEEEGCVISVVLCGESASGHDMARPVGNHAP